MIPLWLSSFWCATSHWWDKYYTSILLSHTSGIDDNWSAMNSVIVDGDSPIPLADFWRGILPHRGSGIMPSKFPRWSTGGKPLLQYRCCTYGLPCWADFRYIFSEYCERNIFSPLEMSETSWFSQNSVYRMLQSLTATAIQVGKQWSITGIWLSWWRLRTESEPLAFIDVCKWRSYRDVSILSEENISEMKRTQYPQLDDTQGLIWYSWEHDGSVYFGHGGSDMGVRHRSRFAMMV